jgi:hypothetical protein
MTMKHLPTVMPLLVFFAAGNISTALQTPSTGSPQPMIHAQPSPAGIAASSDRTTRLKLAQDSTRDAVPRPRSGNSTTSPEPAPPASDPGENRDLDRRASPEASNDLFQLLKQAGPKQGSKPK